MSEITGPSIAPDRIWTSVERPELQELLVVPGVSVCSTSGFMRGHGTFMHEGGLCASLAGTVQQVNKLVSVKPIKRRYYGEVGDVIIGRVVDVQQKRWKINANSRLHSNLMLSSVNLPGGENRRKNIEDELMMREYLKEGDLVCAEVQQVQHDGLLNLHTRNLKYGKLSQGVLVQVPSYLIKRRKTHFHSLPCGAAVVFGCNGFVWICSHLSEDPDGGYYQNLEEEIPLYTRTVISRLAVCIRMLAKHCVFIYETSLLKAYEISEGYETKSLERPDIAAVIVEEVTRLVQHEADDA